jgi:hypothetical protein
VVPFGIHGQGGNINLERLLLPEEHAISVLIKDHDTVKELFDRLEESKSAAEREKIITDALTELKIHAVIEEEIFYPAVRKQVGKDLMNEADEEHHVARVLIAELDRDGPQKRSSRCEVHCARREREAPYKGRRRRDAAEG